MTPKVVWWQKGLLVRKRVYSCERNIMVGIRSDNLTNRVGTRKNALVQCTHTLLYNHYVPCSALLCRKKCKDAVLFQYDACSAVAAMLHSDRLPRAKGAALPGLELQH